MIKWLSKANVHTGINARRKKEGGAFERREKEENRGLTQKKNPANWVMKKVRRDPGTKRKSR